VGLEEVKKERVGEEVFTRALEKGRCAPQIQGALPQSLPRVRPATRIPAQIRHVPHLLPDTGRRGTHPWRDEVELVMATATPATKIVKRAATGIVSDPIADMLTRVRNANSARHPEVRVPASRLKLEIARVLKDEGYIAGYEVEVDGATQTMRIIFKSRPDRTRVISGVKRISRPGLRVYARKTEIPRVLGGLGIAILSTAQGVMSGRQALRQGLGGEVLCYVW
jgi:small subunit ribosomal protein S8